MVNGYDPETGTICQFYRCKWYRCLCLAGSTNDKYCKTINLKYRIRSSGYNVVSVWECESPEHSNKAFQQEFILYPHHILYDFKAVLRERNPAQTSDLMVNCFHIPVSFAINDSLTKEPVFIENQDHERLIEEFVEELTHWQEIISKEVWDKYPMIDESSLRKQV